MKKARVLVALAVVVALLVGVFTVPASAAMSLKVELDKAKVEVNDTVTATVSVDNYVTPLAGFAVTITYDSDAFTLTEVNAENYGGQAVVDPEDLADANGEITIVWFTADPNGIVTVNKLADLTFLAKAESADPMISAGFDADSMTSAGEVPAPILPEEGIFSDEVAQAPAIEVVPEGSLEEPGEDPGEEPEGPNSTSVTTNGVTVLDVKALYISGSELDDYRVELSWKNLDFVYTADKETWDAYDHDYKASAEGSWSANTVDEAITVVNHSSEEVTVQAVATPEENLDVELTIDSNVKTLAAWSAEGEDHIVKYEFGVDGTLAKDFEGQIGTVTVTIGNID